MKLLYCLFLVLMASGSIAEEEENLYEILGVPETASSSEIRKSFKELSRTLHPDKNQGKDELYKRIVAAYETLIDKESRKKYDEKLENDRFFSRGYYSKRGSYSRGNNRANYYGRQDDYRSRSRGQENLFDFDFNFSNWFDTIVSTVKIIWLILEFFSGGVMYAFGLVMFAITIGIQAIWKRMH